MAKWGHGSLHCVKCTETWCVYSIQKDNRSLKSDIAAAKGFGYWGVLSCAQLVSIKNKNKNIYGLNLTKNKNIETQQNFTGS